MAGEEESAPTTPPRQWVEAFYASEQEVRGVLDETREAHVLGRYEQVRDRLRAFADTESGIFRVVTLSVLGAETFFEDVDDQYDEDETAPVDDLRSLGEEYSRLAEEFELLFAEQRHELRNPMPVLRRGFRYSEETSLPRLDYDLYSGDVRLCEFVHPPSQALMLARGVVASTRELLETVEANEDSVAQSERKRVAFVYEKLQEELEQLSEHVDEFDEFDEFDEDSGAAADDERDLAGAERLDEAEAFHDWSVY